jgi:hypothetical protein
MIRTGKSQQKSIIFSAVGCFGFALELLLVLVELKMKAEALVQGQ